MRNIITKVALMRIMEEVIIPIKGKIKKIPLLGEAITKCLRSIKGAQSPFPGSTAFWEQHYRSGGTSGPSSYGRLAESKAYVLNTFVKEHDVQSVVELGCGDGNQLSYASYPQYKGLDISSAAVDFCRQRFRDDKSKSFSHYDPKKFGQQTTAFEAELALSLDVIYHLIEDEIFELYLRHLFAVAQKYVIIYGADTDRVYDATSIVRHRKFSRWIDRHLAHWKLINIIPPDQQKYSYYSFYIYNKICQ